MNVVNAGSSYRIFGEDLKTYHSLPVASYDVCFNPMTGYSLSSRPNLEVLEEKIYGQHESKVAKVMNAFKNVNRNLGVILSGKKGIGKSLFARILAKQAMENNLPLIVVGSHTPGIADFLSSIEQEVVVLFDEFEKTFAENKDERPQEEMLSLFDGIDSGKKLFVITCNEVSKLNPYLLNRPGRFHYHLTLGAPDAEEITEYMTDKLQPEYRSVINDIVGFALNTELTYDCLRAIAFELNCGYSLKETLEDLNITKQTMPKFTYSLCFSDGTIMESLYPEHIDLYSDAKQRYWFTHDGMRGVGIICKPKDIITDFYAGVSTITAENFKVIYDSDLEMDFGEERAKAIREKTATHAVFTRVKDKDYRYVL